MAYSVTTAYDSRIPSWPGNGTPFTLIACHDTEGGQGRAGALGTIQFLIDRADRGASYHELWWYHESTDEFGAIRIVPPYRAAGSVAPQTTVYNPTAWVRESLGRTYWDPNQGIYAVSIAGRVADVERYAKNPKFLVHAHRRMLELWKELGVTRRAEHFQFNPATRSDWGKSLMPALGGLVTSDRWSPPAPTENASMTLMPIKPTAMVIRDGTSIRTRPDLSAESSPWVLTGRAATVTVIAQVPDGFDFGAGPLWFAYVINTGGLRYFHSQDVVRQAVLVDPAPLNAQIATLSGQVTTLTGTVETQSDKIASLMTEVAEAEQAAAEALTRAEAAEEAAGSAVALRAALQTFLS